MQQRNQLKRKISFIALGDLFLLKETAGCCKRPASKVVNILDTLYIIESE